MTCRNSTCKYMERNHPTEKAKLAWTSPEINSPQGHEDGYECVSEHREEQPICKYVDVCVQMYRIIPISPSDGTTKVERCERMCEYVNVNCAVGEA